MSSIEVLLTSGQGSVVSFCPRGLGAALYFHIIVSLCILFYAFESILRRGLLERSMAQKEQIQKLNEYSHMRTFRQSRPFSKNRKCQLLTSLLPCYSFTSFLLVLLWPYPSGVHLCHWPLHLKPWNVSGDLNCYTSASGAGSQMKWQWNLSPPHQAQVSEGIIAFFAAVFAHQFCRFFSKSSELGNMPAPGFALALALTLHACLPSLRTPFILTRSLCRQLSIHSTHRYEVPTIHWYYARQKPTWPQNSRAHGEWGLIPVLWLYHMTAMV